MPAHAEVKILPYSPAQMYALVADVARYPEFLPWTAAARVRSCKPYAQAGAGAQVMEADLVISFTVFREKFGSRVTLLPDESRILTEYIDGPFKHLKSVWKFSDAAGGCTVDFAVDFEFKNPILAGIIGLVFNEAMQRIVRAFEARAKQLYGRAIP